MNTRTQNSGYPKPKSTTSPQGMSAQRHQSDLGGPKLADAAKDAMVCFQEYAKERPDVVALCCIGVGFVLGWKLKPW